MDEAYELGKGIGESIVPSVADSSRLLRDIAVTGVDELLFHREHACLVVALAGASLTSKFLQQGDRPGAERAREGLKHATRERCQPEMVEAYSRRIPFVETGQIAVLPAYLLAPVLLDRCGVPENAAEQRVKIRMFLELYVGEVLLALGDPIAAVQAQDTLGGGAKSHGCATAVLIAIVCCVVVA